MHADFVVAIVELYNRKGIVEVFCIERVNREGETIAHIATLRVFCCGSEDFVFASMNVVCRFVDFGREVRCETARADKRKHFRFVLAVFAEDINNFYNRLCVRINPAGELHRDLIANLFRCCVVDEWMHMHHVVVGNQL